MKVEAKSMQTPDKSRYAREATSAIEKATEESEEEWSLMTRKRQTEEAKRPRRDMAPQKEQGFNDFTFTLRHKENVLLADVPFRLLRTGIGITTGS